MSVSHVTCIASLSSKSKTVDWRFSSCKRARFCTISQSFSTRCSLLRLMATRLANLPGEICKILIQSGTQRRSVAVKKCQLIESRRGLQAKHDETGIYCQLVIQPPQTRDGCSGSILNLTIIRTTLLNAERQTVRRSLVEPQL